MDPAPTVNTTPANRRQHLVDLLTSATRPAPPVSFTYGGRDFAGLVAGWTVSVQELGGTDASPARRTTTYRDPSTGSTVRLQSVEYQDFSAVQWHGHLRNAGG